MPRLNLDFLVSFLDELLLVPVLTYRRVMRIAGKYCMEDVQGRVATIVSKQVDVKDKGELLQETLERLGLMCEFPGRFRLSRAMKVLTSIKYYDISGTDLVPLQGRLDIMAVIIQFAAQGRGRNVSGALEGFGFVDDSFCSQHFLSK